MSEETIIEDEWNTLINRVEDIEKRNRILTIGIGGLFAVVVIQGKAMLNLMKATGALAQMLQDGSLIPPGMGVNATPTDVVDETVTRTPRAKVAEPDDPGPREAPERIKQDLKNMDVSDLLREEGLS